MSSNDVLELNVFCMFGVYGGSRELTERHAIELPKRCFHEFGQYAVVITDVKQFLDRVQDAAKRKGYPSEFRPVKYYDPSTFHGHMTDIEAVFSKPQNFDYQKEFRIAFKTNQPGPLILNVGDLHDISVWARVAP